MAIDFTTNPGGLFPRLGRILKVAYTLTPFEAGLPALFDGIFNQYLTSLEDVGGAVEVQADALVRTPSQVMQFASTTAQNTVTGMVYADQPSQSQTIQAALAEVIRQMKLGGYYVTPNMIAITPTQLTGSIGSGVLVTSTKRGDGLVQENSIQETLRLVCTADSYTGGATAGQEQFGLTGSPSLAGTWDYDFPTGSGASTSVRAVSAAEDASSAGNLLTNSDFEAWSGTTPGPTATLDNWALGGSSAWGTDVRQNATNPFQGTYALQFIAGTGTNSVVYQEFDDTAGTSAVPRGLYSYAVNLWVRKLSGTISAGVLTVELTNDSGTVTTDQQGVNNSFTITCSTLTTSYVAYNVTFRVNANQAPGIRLRLRMSTPLAGGDVLVDSVCYAPLTAMYQGGPGFAVFSGATPFVGGDGWNVAVANDQGGASYLGTFQTGCQRLFTLTNYGLLLPSTGSTLIPNTLITA